MPSEPRHTIIVELDPTTHAELDAMATATSRASETLIAEAIDTFLRVERWRHERVANGLRQAETGAFATEQEVAEVYARRR